MATPEGKVKSLLDGVLARLSKRTPCYVLKPMTFGYGASGHPDVVLVLCGRVVGIEVKARANNAHTNKQRKGNMSERFQRKMAGRLVDAGGYWLCAHGGNLGAVEEFLQALVSAVCDGQWNSFISRYGEGREVVL